MLVTKAKVIETYGITDPNHKPRRLRSMKPESGKPLAWIIKAAVNLVLQQYSPPTIWVYNPRIDIITPAINPSDFEKMSGINFIA